MPSSGTSQMSVMCLVRAREGVCIPIAVVATAALALSEMRRALAVHLRSREMTRVIYGSIIGLALVVALRVHPPRAGGAAAGAAGTAIAVGLAEVYRGVVGGEARPRRRVHWPQVRAKLVEASAVVLGAGF